MPVYQLIPELVFPPAEHAEADGILAVGGDLSPERLILAYQNGIFPWYGPGDPIMWWSPDPRLVLFPDKFKRHKNLRKLVQSGKFEVRFDHNFPAVIKHCSQIARKGQADTWIVDDMLHAYVELHRQGYAHSVETYLDQQLVGGLYGISLGGIFFGESMFHTVTDASKVALWQLVEKLQEWDFDLIDAQQETAHLKSLGAELIGRDNFLHLLKESIAKPNRCGKWEAPKKNSNGK